MARELKSKTARQWLREEVTAKGLEIHNKYGPQIGWEELARLLQDRNFVPYPCELKFDASPLLPGEFAHPMARGETPDEGYTIYIHPIYASQLSSVSYLVLHQLGLLSFGEGATLDDAEVFGSSALGMTKEDYYHTLCELSAQIGGDELV
jgi:hypothetical protein